MNKDINYFMSRTIKIAEQNPIAPFGAIIVYNNQEIIQQSVNTAHSHPLMHGELSVIHTLFENGFDGDKSKLSLYTTAEPCPMCASAIYWAMIPKVIYGSSIPFLNDLFGRQILIRASEVFSNAPAFYSCDLIGGVLEDKCDELFTTAKKIRESQS